MIIQSHRPEGAQYPTIIITVETEEEADALVSIAKHIYPTHELQNMPYYLRDREAFGDNRTLRHTAMEIQQRILSRFNSPENIK